MKSMRWSTLVLAGMLAGCAAEESAPDQPAAVELAPTPVAAELDEGFHATFEQVRAAQDKVLAETSVLLAGFAANPDAAPRDQVEAGLVALNRVIMQNRQAVLTLRSQKDPKAKELIKELRESNSKVRAAFDELLPLHPDPDALPEQVLEETAAQ
jgi:hypothetical protein